MGNTNYTSVKLRLSTAACETGAQTDNFTDGATSVQERVYITPLPVTKGQNVMARENFFQSPVHMQYHWHKKTYKLPFVKVSSTCRMLHGKRMFCMWAFITVLKYCYSECDPLISRLTGTQLLHFFPSSHLLPSSSWKYSLMYLGTCQ